MFSKRLSFGRKTGNWGIALALVAILLLSAVSPAYAAGDMVQLIVVGPQGSAVGLRHGRQRLFHGDRDHQREG